MTFKDFGFDDRIHRGIEEAGFVEPTPVQAQCFDLIIKEERDVYAQSQTGSGKTAAFLLSIFQLKTSHKQSSTALIIVPTRELAVQIEQEATKLARHLELAIGSIYGGVGYAQQERILEKPVDILVGTPGRLLDFGTQNKIDFSGFDFLIIDEADRLFDMGFIPSLRKIINKMKPVNERRTMLFSATLNSKVGNLAWEYMDNPGEIIIKSEKLTVDTVTQELYHVGKDEKMKLLLGVLKRDNPSNVVIFTNTRHRAWEVSKRLGMNDYDVVCMAGDIPQSKRLRILEDLKKGSHKYMVATDVAARGLHIEELEMVINYDVPLEPESYIHRVGRTARAGKSGKTITLACEEYVYGLSPIEKMLGEKIPVSWAEDSLIIEDKSEGTNFSAQKRYKEMENRKTRNSNNAENHRSAGSGTSKRPSYSEKPEGRSSRKAPKSQHPEKNGSPRITKIQSAVSVVAGNSVIDSQEPIVPLSQESGNRPPSLTLGKPDSKSSQRLSAKSRNSTPQKSEEKKPSRLRKPKARNRADEPKMERMNAQNKIEDRLAYYASKYGDDFQVHDKKSKNSGSKKRTQVRDGKYRRDGKDRKLPENQGSKIAAHTPPSQKKNTTSNRSSYTTVIKDETVKKKSLIKRFLGL